MCSSDLRNAGAVIQHPQPQPSSIMVNVRSGQPAMQSSVGAVAALLTGQLKLTDDGSTVEGGIDEGCSFKYCAARPLACCLFRPAGTAGSSGSSRRKRTCWTCRNCWPDGPARRKRRSWPSRSGRTARAGRERRVSHRHRREDCCLRRKRDPGVGGLLGGSARWGRVPSSDHHDGAVHA